MNDVPIPRPVRSNEAIDDTLQERLQPPPTISDADLVDWICNDLIRRIRADESIGLEAYMQRFPEVAERDDDLLDLVDAELCAKAELGQQPSLPEYQQRFPRLANRLERMFVLHALDEEQRRQSTSRQAACVAAERDQEQEEPPRRLGDYQIIGLLGRGAMSRVYRARQLSVDREVAVKVFDNRRLDHPTSQFRFLREVYAVGQLNHPHIVSLYEMGRDGALTYFSMELVEGRSLAELLQSRGRLDIAEALGYVLQAAQGLHYLHQQGMVHRDIKPSNVLVGVAGHVKITDLGLVKTPGTGDGQTTVTPEAPREAARAPLTTPESIVGTPAYMSPEQARDPAHVDPRADVYSLGCTFYALLTGKPPRTGVRGTTTPQRPEFPGSLAGTVERVPERMWDLVARMIAPRAEDRFADLKPVIEQLESLGEPRPEVDFRPDERHQQMLDDAVDGFESSPAAKLEVATAVTLPLALLGLAAILPATAPRLAVTATLTGLLLPIQLVAFRAVRGDSALLLAARSSLPRNVIAASLVVAVASLAGWGCYQASLEVEAVVALILSGLVAVAHGKLFAHWTRQQRAAALAPLVECFSRLRQHGVRDDRLQRFVMSTRWAAWERVFETLFGHSALRRCIACLTPAARATRPLTDRLRRWAIERLAT